MASREDIRRIRNGEVKKVRVDLTAVVQGGSDYAPPVPSVTGVRETGGVGSHYLYLPSPGVTGNKSAGGTVTARFDAEVAGPVEGSDLVTTKVRELSGDGVGYTHYIYLDRPGITVIEDDAPPAPPAAEAPAEPAAPAADDMPVTVKVTSFSQLSPGDMVTVAAFTGTVADNSAEFRTVLAERVKLRDPNGSNVHWFPGELLSRPVPFKDGLLYADGEGCVYRFTAGMGGRWVPYPGGTDPYEFSYPPRPMSGPVTVGTEISE